MNNSRFYSDRTREFFLRESSQIKQPKNQIIIDPYKSNSYVYYIDTGFIKTYSLTKNGQTNLLIIYNDNETFPLQLIHNSDLGSYLFYESKTEVELYKVPMAKYWSMLSENKEFLKDNLTQAQISMEVYSNTIESLQYRTAREKVISKLLFLGWRFGDDQSVIEAPITHQELADYLGLSRETVSRTMESLREKGMIVQQKRRIIIKNRSKLLKEL